MIDLDRFKPVNDGMGHQAGDLLLRQVADAIVAASRDSDRVFRYGGDEFAVLLPRTDGDQVGPIAERVRAAVKGVVGPGSSLARPRALARGVGRHGVVPGRRRDAGGGPARGGPGAVRRQALAAAGGSRAPPRALALRASSPSRSRRRSTRSPRSPDLGDRAGCRGAPRPRCPSVTRRVARSLPLCVRLAP